MGQVHERVSRYCFSKVLWFNYWKPSGGDHSSRSERGCDGFVQRASEDREQNYTPQMCRQEHLSKVLDLCVFVMSHVSLTLYSFDFRKCSDVSCCGAKRSPSRFQVVAMQRQPTPRLDKNGGTSLLATIVGVRKVAADGLSEPAGRRRTGSLCSSVLQ